jgi:hypothetical protein
VRFHWHRTLSGLLVAALLTGVVIHGSPANILNAVLGLSAILCFIWFPDVVGSVRAIPFLAVDRGTPTPIVRALGWILLLIATVFGIINAA